MTKKIESKVSILSQSQYNLEDDSKSLQEDDKTIFDHLDVHEDYHKKLLERQEPPEKKGEDQRIKHEEDKKRQDEEDKRNKYEEEANKREEEKKKLKEATRRKAEGKNVRWKLELLSKKLEQIATLKVHERQRELSSDEKIKIQKEEEIKKEIQQLSNK